MRWAALTAIALLVLAGCARHQPRGGHWEGTYEASHTIVAAWVAAMAQYPGIIFIATPGSIVVKGDEAEVRSYTSEVFDDQSNAKTTRDRGRYDDLVVRQNGRWLFKKRRFKKLHREQ